MKFLRKKFPLRSFSVFCVLLALNNIIYPNISYALTTGPHQPEYTSYEEPSASDMVNLLTGDFTFNMPVLSVPIGSEGGFTLPLSYHAGIGTEQESSWIGLGWNMNPGAITRSINGFPDDANSQSQTVTVQDLTGQKGWSADILGSTFGWDSQKGHYGTIDLTLGTGVGTVGYNDGGINSYQLAGLSLTNGKPAFDGAKFGMAMVQIAISIATFGVGSAAEAAVVVACQLSMQLTMDALMPNMTPQVGTNGYWEYTKQPKKNLFHTDYWISLDQTRVEDMYGVLNLDKAPAGPSNNQPNFLKISEKINANQVANMYQFLPSGTLENQGAASDVTTDLSTQNYWDNANPLLLAYDNFNVNGPGISGGIKPYRMETGSVSVPREMSANHVRFNPVGYVDYGSNKVPFIYEGSMGNEYFNHVGAASGSVTSPDFYFGLNSSLVTSSSGTPGPNTNYLQYDLNDVIFDNQRLGSNLTSSKKLPQGHFVNWLTNLEAKTSGKFTGTDYMDYFRGYARSAMRGSFGFTEAYNLHTSSLSNGGIFFPTDGVLTFDPQLRVTDKIAPNDLVDAVVSYTDQSTGQPHTLSQANIRVKAVSTNSITVESLGGYTSMGTINDVGITTHLPTTISNDAIGGFVITDPSGMNYHFAIPVYDYAFHSETSQIADLTKRNLISRQAPFANTWLLTAITGPDFVDRGGANNTGDGYIDENDWGYWVKFNYSKQGSNYKWALPYSKQKRSSDDLYNTYALGTKEKYFLSTIETRSHVAMFLQGSRQDGRDASGAPGTEAPRLAEINLITKDAYGTLLNKYDIQDASGALTTYNVSNFTSYAINFLRASAIKRIVFNQDYSLCNGVPTSISGKLTLNSLSLCGRYDSTANNPNKVFPDYKFEYANNPSYDENKWDGWGMYSSQAAVSGLTHKASPSDADGSAWSLTKVINPEGSEILVTYERDTYTSISGQSFPSSDNTSFQCVVNNATTNTTYAYPAVYDFQLGDASKLKVGDPIVITGTATYTCPGPGNTQSSVSFNTQGTPKTIAAISGNSVTLDQPYTLIPCANASQVTNIQVSGTVTPLIKRGGNIRVSSLTLNDPSGVSYKTQYQYDNGTVSVEPDYIKTSDLFFYNYLNYAASPVLYGQVTVFSGKLTTSNDYHTRQVYNFITPNTSQYTINTAKIKDKELMSVHQDLVHLYKDYSSLIKHEISRHTSQIGKITSISTFDNNFNLYSQSNYYYTENPTNGGENNYQGIFSEGTLLHEAVANGLDRYHRAQRTTSLSYPFTLQKVVTTTDGFTTTTENKDWDQMTGGVLETRSTSPLGAVVQSITVPAYKIQPYAEFDSKAKNPANKNMLTQTAARYAYKLDNSGNQIGLLSASATTWTKNWQNYRVLDANNNYINSSDPAVTQIWRTNQEYVWKGNYSRLQSNGTQSFSASDKFNFISGASNSGWQLAGSKERYSHNSILLETKDMNGIYSSSKRGYLDQHTIASASNATYEEMAYSGAEDQPASGYFGGEVAVGSGTIISSAHTGTKGLSVSSGYGFVFKSTGLASNKTYRASVWTNSTDGRLYYKLNGGSEVSSLAPAAQTKAGNWYRVDLLIPSGNSFSTIEVGVKSATGAAVTFDDFRFQPLQSAMTGYVYDPVTRNLTHALDNDNMYTRYEYNGRGQLIKTYMESFKYGGEKLVVEKKDDFRRFHTN